MTFRSLASNVRYQVRLTAKAEQDVATVLQWFHDQAAVSAGASWFEQLRKKIATLELHPERCALAAEAADLGPEIRELTFGRRRGKYRLLFQTTGRTVFVI